MKIRTGFVSNSSSSSFIVIGNGDVMNGALEHGNTFRNVPHIVISNH